MLLPGEPGAPGAPVCPLSPLAELFPPALLPDSVLLLTKPPPPLAKPPPLPSEPGPLLYCWLCGGLPPNVLPLPPVLGPFTYCGDWVGLLENTPPLPSEPGPLANGEPPRRRAQPGRRRSRRVGVGQHLDIAVMQQRPFAVFSTAGPCNACGENESGWYCRVAPDWWDTGQTSCRTS